MAPAAQAPAKRAIYDGSKPRFESMDAWLNVYGQVEYNVYKRTAKSYALSYDDWTKSEHVLGPYLWYMTLDVWEESSSSVSIEVRLLQLDVADTSRMRNLKWRLP